MSAPTPGRRALLGGAAALLGAGAPLGATATPDPDADAEIVAACDRYIATEREWRRRLALDHDAIAADAYAGVLDVAENAVANLPPATTMAGLRAKARAVLAFYGADLSEDCALSPTLWEVLHAVAGVPVSGA